MPRRTAGKQTQKSQRQVPWAVTSAVESTSALILPMQLKDYIKTRVMNETQGEKAHYRLLARYGLLASRLEWQSDGYYIIAVNLVHIRKVRGIK